MLLNEGTPVISEDCASRETFERVVTHNDFDGIVSASICCWALKIEKVFFTGPLTITHSKVTITEQDVVCDLPYPVVCGLWFDHHQGNLEELDYRKIDPASIPGRFALKRSCSRVVHDYFLERMDLPHYFVEAVEEADVIDSFAYSSIEDWRKDTPGNRVDSTLKIRFPSAEDQATYMRALVQHLRDRPLEEVSRLPSVQRHLKQYLEVEGQMLRIIKDSSFFLDQDEGKEVAIIDLTQHRRRPHLIKNLAFLIYPDALGVLEIYNLTEQGVKSNHLGLSMSLSINGNREHQRKNIGEIMRTLNIGDGHPGAAAGTVRCASKQEMLKKKKDLLNQIFRLWASQQTGVASG